MDLSNSGGLEEHEQFQEYLSDYKIVVFDGQIGLCLVESPFWTRHFISYMMRTLGTIM